MVELGLKYILFKMKGLCSKVDNNQSRNIFVSLKYPWKPKTVVIIYLLGVWENTKEIIRNKNFLFLNFKVNTSH